MGAQHAGSPLWIRSRVVSGGGSTDAAAFSGRKPSAVAAPAIASPSRNSRLLQPLLSWFPMKHLLLAESGISPVE